MIDMEINKHKNTLTQTKTERVKINQRKKVYQYLPTKRTIFCFLFLSNFFFKYLSIH